MKTLWSYRSLILSFFALFVIFVHLSDGLAISSREEKTNKKSENDIKPQKKPQFHNKKYKSPIVIEQHKKSPKNKLKISDLRPCISKAFCEVNSITEEPTYETSKEFYLILNRLKKFIDEDRIDDTGSGSYEEEESSEESYERGPPYYMSEGPHRSGGEGYYPPYPYHNNYRHGKSLGNDSRKLTKKKKKLAKTEQLLMKSINGTNNETISVKVKKVYTPAQMQKRAFVDRKTQELNVVDDLAALIKISAEIGQALRSPRRCRSLFKKCRMNYEQIIRIFNRTQSVETSSDHYHVPSTPPKITPSSHHAALVVEPQSPLSPTTSDETDADADSPLSTSSPSLGLDNSTKSTDQEEKENVSDGDGNRNKKSRTDFSEEDPEYPNDDSDSQPVKTYSLFSTSHSDSPSGSNSNNGDKKQESIVDEAFQKFEKVFPSSGASSSVSSSGKKKYQTPETSRSKRKRPVVASSSEEEEEEEGSNYYNKQHGDYHHRLSAEEEENDNQDSEEVEMEVPDKKIKTKHNTKPIKESAQIAGEVDETEDDSDAEIASSEIGKKPPLKKGADSSEEETSEEEKTQQSNGGSSIKNDDQQGDLIYTREDDKSGGFNSFGFYPQVRPSFIPKHTKKSVKSKGKRRKGNKKGQKDEEPQNDQQSSEENPNNPDYMPPPGSDFYQVLKQADNEKGGDGIPEKHSNSRRKKSKKPKHKHFEDYQDYSNNKPSPYGRPGYGPSHYDNGPPQADDHQGSSQQQQQQQAGGGGFFQSLMGWFSRGTKSSSPSEEQQQGVGVGGPQPPPPQSGNKYGGYFGSGERPSYGGQESESRPQSYGGKPPMRYSGYDDDMGGGPGRYKPQQYGDERDKMAGGRYPSQSPQKQHHVRYRGDESSEEEEDEEEEEENNQQVRPNKRQIQQKQQQQQQHHQTQSNRFQSSSIGSGLRVSGPPPPLVIVPPGEEPDYPNDRNNQKQKQEKPQKTKQKEEFSDEELASKENSSEEVAQKKKNQSNNKKNNKKKVNKDQVFSGIFASAAEIDKQIIQDREDDDKDDTSLLLSTFDNVANTFSTSADKITDWSKEENSRKKVNVGSLASSTRGKYTVKKNKNKNVGQHEGEDNKNDKASSEEEEEEEEDNK